jgi:hypothetical protein
MGNPLAGVGADVYMAANPSILVADEAADNTDSGAWILYRAHTHIFWDKAAPIVVQTAPTVGGTYTTATDYVFEYAGGVIIFNTARVGGTNNFVRIHAGNYYNLTELDSAQKWAFTLKGNTKDTTSFQQPGAWNQMSATTRQGSGKIDTVRSDGRIFLELGNVVALQLFVDKTNNLRWDILAHVTGIDPSNSATDVNAQAMSFDSEGDFYFRST